jgi:chorismate mutase
MGQNGWLMGIITSVFPAMGGRRKKHWREVAVSCLKEVGGERGSKADALLLILFCVLYKPKGNTSI